MYPPDLNKVNIIVEVWFFAEKREGEILKKPSNYHRLQIEDVFVGISLWGEGFRKFWPGTEILGIFSIEVVALDKANCCF